MKHKKEGKMNNHFKFWMVGCAVAVLSGGLSASSQANPKVHVDRPVVPARAEDVSTIEGIVKASYETISGGVGVPRQWGRDRTLYDPYMRFVSMGKDPKSGKITRSSGSEQDYADHADAYFVKAGFTEHELAHTIHRFGDVATVLSSYEGKETASNKPADRGVNIFQLYNDGKRWWILSIAWDEERPDNPIPAELLEKKQAVRVSQSR
jgi:hypothetical protein